MVVLGVHAKLCISLPLMVITLMALAKGTAPLTKFSLLYFMVVPVKGQDVAKSMRKVALACVLYNE